MIALKKAQVITIAISGLLVVGGTGCSTTKIKSSAVVTGDTLYTNKSASGWPLELEFTKGSAHNHPLMAIWVCDTSGNYLETLYIAESIAKGYFDHADKSQGKWQPGPTRRPAALPVWAHERNVREADGLYVPTIETAIPDAITGATPTQNFVLFTKKSTKIFPVFDVYFEINQSWDWNEYWTNNKFPEDAEYKTSCQPALVYKARIDATSYKYVSFELIGHSSYNGSDGSVTSDLGTMTTALQIAKEIKIRLLK